MFIAYKKLILSLLISFSFCFIHFDAQSQNLRQWVAEADSLEKVPNEKAALEKLLLVLKYNPTHLYALSKSSEFYSRIGKRLKDEKAALQYYQTAFELAERAVKVNALDDGANVSLAMALGRLGMTKSGKEKVKAAKDIKTYVEVALKTNPANFKAWHILGKWHYEVSNLNFIEKAALKLLYGGMPESSLDKALEAYKKAQQYAPLFVLNYLEMAKAYYRKGETGTAKELLNKIAGMKTYTEDDVIVKAEAKQLMKQWK